MHAGVADATLDSMTLACTPPLSTRCRMQEGLPGRPNVGRRQGAEGHSRGADCEGEGGEGAGCKGQAPERLSTARHRSRRCARLTGRRRPRVPTGRRKRGSANLREGKRESPHICLGCTKPYHRHGEAAQQAGRACACPRGRRRSRQRCAAAAERAGCTGACPRHGWCRQERKPWRSLRRSAAGRLQIYVQEAADQGAARRDAGGGGAGAVRLPEEGVSVTEGDRVEEPVLDIRGGLQTC